MAEHIYMFSGESVDTVLLADKSQMNELVDWLGSDFRILEENEKELKIKIRMNPVAMKYWALQYGPFVEVLEPVELRNEIRDSITKMLDKYI